MKLVLDIDGIDLMERNLDGITREQRQAVIAVNSATALAIRLSAIREYPPPRQPGRVTQPKGTPRGRLKLMTTAEFYPDEMAAEVLNRHHASRFYNYGTGQRGAASPKYPWCPLPPGYAHGPTAGMAAHPVMHLALERERENYTRAVDAAIGRTVRA